jgi:hypothetical protein
VTRGEVTGEKKSLGSSAMSLGCREEVMRVI